MSDQPHLTPEPVRVMSNPNAQIRFVYEQINPRSGMWETYTSSWQEATPTMLKSWQKVYSENHYRADRRNWRIEFRRFSKQIHQMDIEDGWEALNQLIAEVVDPPDPIRVVITGSPTDGFSLFGPFDSFEAANRFGGDLGEDWWTTHVGRPGT